MEEIGAYLPSLRYNEQVLWGESYGFYPACLLLHLGHGEASPAAFEGPLLAVLGTTRGQMKIQISW